MATITLTNAAWHMSQDTTWENEVISATSTQVVTRDPGDGRRVTFLGSGIAFNADGDVTAGTVTGVRGTTATGTVYAEGSHAPVPATTLAQTVNQGGLFAYARLILGGDDTISATNDEIDDLIGFGGNDVLYGGGGGDILDGDYVFEAASGDDTIYGGDGADTVRGLGGSDVLYGDAGGDDLNGNLGADLVFGGDGNDSVRGGQGNDVVYGGADNDGHVNGNVGADTVYGGAGNDLVFGGQDGDVLYGEEGGDVMSGDLGNDTLTGGAGSDRFLILNGTGNDIVTDFSFAGGDRILMPAGTAYTVTSSGGNAVVHVGTASLTLTGVASTEVQSNWVAFF